MTVLWNGVDGTSVTGTLTVLTPTVAARTPQASIVELIDQPPPSTTVAEVPNRPSPIITVVEVPHRPSPIITVSEVHHQPPPLITVAEVYHQPPLIPSNGNNKANKRALETGEDDIRNLKLPPQKRPRGRPRKIKHLDRYKFTPKPFLRKSLNEKVTSTLQQQSTIAYQ